MIDLAALLVAPTDSIRSVMACIDRNGKGVALVVNLDRRLVDTVTDGDLRRAVLAHLDLDSSIQTLLERKVPTVHGGPLTAPAGTPIADLLHLMSVSELRQIPLIDTNRRVVDIVLLDELVKEYELPMTAVVMAGGYGARLRPLTDEVPKPMLPIGDEPLLAIIIRQLRDAGIRRLNLATHYKAEVIEQHFGDGQAFGVDIEYVQEETPLGTAGALRLLDAPDQPLLVINGDILTTIDFRAMLQFHREHKADMTVAVRQYEVVVPFGVVEIDGAAVTGICEKPVIRNFVSAGVYLVNPDVPAHIPAGERYDMPDLINNVIARGGRVVSFPVLERWQDIGRLEDYRRALDELARRQDSATGAP